MPLDLGKRCKSHNSVEVSGQQSNPAVRARLRRIQGCLTDTDQEIRELGSCPGTSSRTSRPRKRQRRLSSEQVQTLVAAYGAGIAVNELALHFKVHRATVLDHLNRSGSKRRYPALDQNQVAEAARLYRSGKSFRDVGIAFGVHASTVRHHLLRAGLEPRSRNGS
jgi:DNA invertase Pin-like site-specific DNA recombinase